MSSRYFHRYFQVFPQVNVLKTFLSLCLEDGCSGNCLQDLFNAFKTIYKICLQDISQRNSDRNVLKTFPTLCLEDGCSGKCLEDIFYVFKTFFSKTFLKNVSKTSFSVLKTSQKWSSRHFLAFFILRRFWWICMWLQDITFIVFKTVAVKNAWKTDFMYKRHFWQCVFRTCHVIKTWYHLQDGQNVLKTFWANVS